MITRFFIDRPIFATVLSVVITLIGGIALFSLPIAQYPRITPPGIVISISYPGASAQVVADTVAAPIEQQVNGIDGMLYMSSQMGNDGTYALTVTFDVGTDLNSDLVMVQNRVALAMPQLPTQVQNQGITIRKKTPDILMIVNFFSPNGRYDDIYLSNFATIYVRDELLRVYGVSDVNYLGQRDYSIRAWLDPQKLAARNMTPMDVADAIRNQNLDAPAGRLGQPPASPSQSTQLPIDTLGRLTEPEQFEDIIVKADPATPPDLAPIAGATSPGGRGGGAAGSSGSRQQAAMANALAPGPDLLSQVLSGSGPGMVSFGVSNVALAGSARLLEHGYRQRILGKRSDRGSWSRQPVRQRPDNRGGRWDRRWRGSRRLRRNNRGLHAGRTNHQRHACRLCAGRADDGRRAYGTRPTPSSGSATSHGSNWEPRTTTSRAHSTDALRWGSPFTSFPAPTRSTSPSACRRR